MKALNIPSGNNYKKSTSGMQWTNVDLYHPQADERIDILQRLPYGDNTFDYILCEHILEHIYYEQAVKLLRELQRILKTGGTAYISTSHYSGSIAHAPANRILFDSSSFIEILHTSREAIDAQRGLQHDERKTLFNIASIGLRRVNRNTRKTHFFNHFLDFLATTNPTLCERSWVHWVGGFEEIYAYVKK